MNSETNAWRSVFLGAIATLLFCSAFLIPARSEEKPRAKVIELDSHGKDYLPVLTGPPETVTMKSGLEVLAPNQSVG
ncbi:MAG: hypothetical protein WA180_14660, partial [Candidatus Sulfotelmatobacter sp.]